MNKKSIFSQFLNFPLFTKQTIVNTTDRFLVPKNTINVNIKRAIFSKELIVLKRGSYVTQEFFIENKTKLSYIFYVASKLLEPSYISRESALQYYGLLSEANNTVVTCVSRSTTRRFSNSLGIFDYKTIKPELFCGYNNVNEEFNFYIAEPHKAIFDYLYFRIPRAELRSEKKILEYLDEFRIDYDDLKKTELDKLFALALNIW